jgi:RNA-directed DNA polymerase
MIKVNGVPRVKKRNQRTYSYIRYADDFVVTAKAREDIEALLPTLADWLRERGLELNLDKTRIVHITEGFDFLGFHIQQFNGKCIITPQKAKVLAFLQTIGAWLKAHPHLPPAAVIAYLNPRLRGWGNYYKHVSSKRVFNYVDTQIWKKLWRWALNRHPTKGKIWVAKRYFTTYRGRKWTFYAQTTNRQGDPTMTTLFRVASIPIERHIKVKGTASPDDPLLSAYWQQRRIRDGNSYWSPHSTLRAVAERQHWTCPVCGQHLFNGEALHTHHKLPVRMGGSNTTDNLVHLHQDCHSHVHQQHDLPTKHLA